jgi:hypothetical protein
MNDSGNVSLQEPNASGDGISTTETNPLRGAGPDLKPLCQWKLEKLILRYAWKHHHNQIIIMILVVPILAIGLHAWNELYPPIQILNATTVASLSPLRWTDWFIGLQAFFSVGTFLVALSVWHGKIRDDWQNELPKRMSVFFFHKGDPAIVCRYVWLASADDLRAWGQQVATQAVENDRSLKFGPDVKTQVPELAVDPDGIVCRHYTVRFRLKELPSLLKKKSDTCRYQNFAADYKEADNIPLAQAKELRVVKDWKEPADN